MSGSPSNVFSLVNVNGTLYAGTFNGSNDVWSYNGTTWTQMIGSPSKMRILYVNGTLYAIGSLGMAHVSLIPDAPSGVSAAAGDGQATISFTAPVNEGGTAITGYTVTANPGGLTATGATSPITIAGLTNGTAYTFTVVATNAAGNSADSSAVSVTPQVPIPGAPVLQSPVAGNAQVTLTWNPVNGSTGYKVFQSVTSGTYGNEVATVSGSVYSSTVTGLTNGANYYFVVKAVNPGGESAASNQVSAMPIAVPGAPTGITAVAGNSQATITFTTPTDNGGRPITGYEVTSSPGNIIVTGAASPITITGLTNGTAYTFTVKAINGVGKSVASAISNTVTPSAPVVLAAPTNLAATAGNSQINLTWSSVTGATYYNVYQSLDNVTYHLISTPAAVTALAYQVTGLTNGSLYYFKISAANTVTESTYSNAASATPTSTSTSKSKSTRGGTPSPTTAPPVTSDPTPTPEPTNPTVDAFKSSVVNVANLIKAIESKITEAKKANDKVELTDTKGHWAEKTIDTFVKLHIIDGYGDGKFHPNGNITRAEFATLISRVFDISGGTGHSVALSDVSSHWAKDAIEKLVSAGVLDGYSDGTFKPDQTISREEIVIILSRIVNLDHMNKDASKGNFTDMSSASPYAANAIKDAAEAGVITGKSDGVFDPKGKATRVEALTVVLNVLNLNPQIKNLLDSLN
ncbi:adhesin [Paenibacillus rigui]|uniref:Adhesin n=2 Tax=Paenibacillus rigui TaxID=554312 RepID=A0A229UGQ7_9BACL|nr:adhesin [Paenibacillus rigui]